jgi:hypothetical protein
VSPWLRLHTAVKHIKMKHRVPFAMEIIIVVFWRMRGMLAFSEMKTRQLLNVKKHSRKSSI